MMMRSFVAGVVLVGGIASVESTQARAAETYKADTVHSSVVFRVKHANTAYFWGRFNDISGAFTLDSANPAQVKLDFQVKADSVDTGQPKRDQHLKGPDVFNVVQFPTLSFTSKSVQAAGSGYEVQGDLTLHGVTKPVTVKVTPTGTGKGPTGAAIAGIEATFTVRQSEFGITKLAPAIGDDVWVNVSVEGVKK
jgi:polyisoprenoid-binding protein YceI